MISKDHFEQLADEDKMNMLALYEAMARETETTQRKAIREKLRDHYRNCLGIFPEQRHRLRDELQARLIDSMDLTA